MILLSACGGSRAVVGRGFSGRLLRYRLKYMVVRGCGDTDDSVLPTHSAVSAVSMSATVSFFSGNSRVYQRPYTSLHTRRGRCASSHDVHGLSRGRIALPAASVSLELRAPDP